MSLAGGIFAQRRAILAVTVALVAAGLVAALRMPVSLFPAIRFPRVVVTIDAGDRPAERMALEITTPVEQAMRGLPDVATIRSTTSRGTADVSVSFSWGADMELAVLRCETAATRLATSLPPGTRIDVRRMDPTVFPCVACSMTSATRSLPELRALAIGTVRPALIGVSGVATVAVQGGSSDEVQVLVDGDRLRAHGLGLEDVAEAVGNLGAEVAIGRIEDRETLYLALTAGTGASADAVAATPLRATGRGVVRVADVARVVTAPAASWTRVAADGEPAIALQVYQRGGGSTVAISRGVAAALADARSRLPADVRLAVWYDQSDLIVASARSVLDAVLIGSVLAAVVLVVFLRSWRTTAVALLALPAVLAVTVLVLHLCGHGFDIMTLGGIAAAVGLVIDDAIVVVERIVAQRRDDATQGPVATVGASLAFAPALAASSAASLVIFVPLAFLSGVTGAFFTSLALTMAVALGVSFALALLVLPVIAALALRRDRAPASARHADGQRKRLATAYAAVMRPLLARPWLVTAIIVPLALAGWWAYSGLGTGFMPVMDEGGFILDYRAAPGTSLTETDRLVRRVEAVLRSTTEVATTSRRTGLQLGGGLTEANEGDLFVRLKPQPRASCDEVMDDVRRRVRREVPELRIELTQLMEDLIGDLIANPHPIEIELSSGDPRDLDAAAEAVAARIAKIPGIVDVSSGVVPAGDAVRVVVDADAAAREGLDGAAIAKQLETQLEGRVVADGVRDGIVVGVRVWTIPATRRRLDDLAALTLRAANGSPVPLARVARTVVEAGQPQIVHQDLRRSAIVTARLEARDLGSAAAAIEDALRETGVVPTGVTHRLGGIYAQQRQAFVDLCAVIAMATALLLVLLLVAYRSVRVAVAVVATSATSLAGVALGLRLTGTELNLTSMMGAAMVLGIVTEVSVLLVSAYAELAGDGSRSDRLIHAAIERSRPIAMTVIAAVLALAPLAIGYGEGAAMLQPLAIAIVSGLIVQAPLALIALPMLFAWWKVDPRRDR